ncbi:hypothetical protein P43SY_003395 [Pythium insidiosum]|uniref:Alpha-ketoglutarate-dependent dioxygenase AlkB-like domain-containing protein n=1 Tax=Pythium insidiosum TaxID=114742 RepID=A0AAD5M7N0_PYTIN|nr:hypothetical protein P43SY_003395 [Pythium insidiosum]
MSPALLRLSSCARRTRVFSCTSRPLSTSISSYGWRQSALVDPTKCADPLVGDGDLLVMPDVITEEEEQIVAEECKRLLRRRRYEENHWDSVIVKFKEMERSRWSAESASILDRVRRAPIVPQHLTYFPSVHVIDLDEEGYIMPHVDAIKFSGEVVAGISLLSPSIMRFKEEHGESIIEAHLPRRSMYMMTGRVRYHYTHEILPGVQLFRGVEPVHRTRRISIMLRDFHPDELATMAPPPTNN